MTCHRNPSPSNNQPDALFIQIYSVIKLYMFRATFCPPSGVSYCKFGLGKFRAGYDDRFLAELGCSIPTLLGSGHHNLHETYQGQMYSRRLLMMGKDVARNIMQSFMTQ